MFIQKKEEDTAGKISVLSHDVADILRQFAWHVSFNQLMESESNAEEAEWHLKKSEQYAATLRRLLSASTEDMKQLVAMLVAACRHCVLESKQHELHQYDEYAMNVSITPEVTDEDFESSFNHNGNMIDSSKETEESAGDDDDSVKGEADVQKDIFEKASEHLTQGKILTKELAMAIKWLFWNCAWHAVHVKSGNSDRQECFKKIVRHTNELFWDKDKWNGIFCAYDQPEKLTNVAISGLNAVRIVVNVESWRNDDDCREKVLKFLQDAESFALAVIVQFSSPADSSDYPVVAAVREFASRVEGKHKCVQGIAVSVSNSSADNVSSGVHHTPGFAGPGRGRMHGSGFVAAIVQGVRAHLSPADCAILVEAGELGYVHRDSDDNKEIKLYPEVAALFELTLNEVRSPSLQTLHDCNLVWEFDSPPATRSNPVDFVQELLDWGNMMDFSPLSCCREWQPPARETYGEAFRNEIVWRHVQAFNDGSTHGSFFGSADEIPNAFPLYQNMNLNNHSRVNGYTHPFFLYNPNSSRFIWRRKLTYVRIHIYIFVHVFSKFIHF